MAKYYTVVVRKDVCEGNQWNPEPVTYIIPIHEGYLHSYKEAENLRATFNKMSQERMQKKFGDGFYHGLEIREHIIHEPGEAFIKWKKCGEMFTKELFDKFADMMPLETKEMHVLLRTQFEKREEKTGKPGTYLLSLFRTGNGYITGTLKHTMYYDWIGCLRVLAYAVVEEVPGSEYDINSEQETENQ